MEIWGLIIGTILTLLIFSYMLKDTVLYRWGLALLVGCGVGYGLGLAWHHILREWISNIFITSPVYTTLFYLIPLVLGALLLLKGFAPHRAFGRLSVLGNIPLAFLVGVGTATAVSGALVGTLIPQIIATGAAMSLKNSSLGLIQGFIILIGTITTLLFFSSAVKTRDESAEGHRFSKWVTRVGQFFIVIALGFTFSGAITSALTTLILRLWKLSDAFRQIISFGGG